MKQKLIALGLCGAVCASLTVPALAAGESGPDPAREYSVTWEELDGRVRSGSATARSLQESAGQLEAIDYDQMRDDIKDSMVDMADLESYYSDVANSPLVGTAIPVGSAASAALASGQFSSAYAAYQDAYDDLEDGVTQQDYADVIRQLQYGVDQVVAGSQTLYLAILGLEQSLDDGNRGLATIDRSLEEVRLRNSLGQVSQDTVTSLEQTRQSTVSQLKSLETAISTYKSQLQVLIGEEPTGELTLAPLPEDAAVSEDGEAAFDWDALDYGSDLARAKENSWTLYDAKNTLNDARDDYRDNKYPSWKYQGQMAEHAWSSAQATYDAAVQNFETSFQALYDSLANYQQIWQSKQSATAYQEKLVANAQMKYERGMGSRNALLDAQDGLDAARSEEESAWRDLFSARNSYRNAVEKGLLGSSN